MSIPQTEILTGLVANHGDRLVRIESPRHRGATGILLGRGDLVLTTSHAVPHDDAIGVGLPDGSTALATLAGRDHATDLALVKLPAAAPAAPALAIRDAAALRVGEVVLALARPGQSVRAALGILGVVGGEFRTHQGGSIERWVELDRDLPRGFSGGLVLDLEGAVVGVATRSLVRGAAMALPGGTVARVLAQLEAHGHVPHGWLGIGVVPVRLPRPLADAEGQRAGIVVVGLEDDGPASKAGLQVGDVLLRIDDEQVDSPMALRAALQGRASRDVTIHMLRAGSAIDLAATTGTRA
jgi:S1-C subfamily serine protease